MTAQAPHALELVVPGARDVEWISVAIYPWTGTYRWALRGLTLRPDEVADRVWRGVGMQYAIVSPATGPVALVQLYDIDLHSDIGYLSLLLGPVTDGEALSLALSSAITKMFDMFPLRKLYMPVLSHVADAIVSYLPWRVVEEARLTDHERRNAQEFADLVYLALPRP